MTKAHVLFALALVAPASFAIAQEASPTPKKAHPAAYTVENLKKLYREGLEIRYMRTVFSKGKPPRREFVFQEVVKHGKKGYLLRERTFTDKGLFRGEPKEPRPFPYKVSPETFTRAASYNSGKLVIGKTTYEALRYSYKVKLGRHEGWRNMWYSAKHPGLLLKIMDRPVGDFGKKTYTTFEIMDFPKSLGGKAPFGAPKGNLIWTDRQIAQTWTPDSTAEYQITATAKGEEIRHIRLVQTMIGRDGISYLLRDQMWEKEKLTSDNGRPRMWVAYLGILRRAPQKFVRALKDETVEAAGRKWPCKVFQVAGAKETFWYLSKDVPGLVVKFVSKNPTTEVTRILTKTSLKPANGPK